MNIPIQDGNNIFPVRVGKCIYCDDEAEDLSDEHVVPLGLGGAWKLLDASCNVCRDTTSLFELRVLRRHFWDARTVLQMQTRRPKERPQALTQRVVVDGETQSHSLKPEHHPGQLVFPIFPPPTGFADTRKDRQVEVVDVRLASRKGRLEALTAETRAEKWTFPVAEPETFARFIGKIGYCFGVGVFGHDIMNDDSVRPFIRDGGGGIATWVGTRDAPDEGPDDGGHHVSAAVAASGELVVYVRLFSVQNSPVYMVIVGRA
jgi:hypothetical protein